MKLSRTDIVEIARGMGVQYSELRDWAMGSTVRLMHGREKVELGENTIDVYQRSLYIAENEDGFWADACECSYWTVKLSANEIPQLIESWLFKDYQYLDSIRHEKAYPYDAYRRMNNPEVQTLVEAVNLYRALE